MDATIDRLIDFSSLGKLKMLTIRCGFSRVAAWIYQINRESDLEEIKSGDLVLVQRKSIPLSLHSVRQCLNMCYHQQAAAVVFPSDFLFTPELIAEIETIGLKHDLAVFQMPETLSQRVLINDVLLYIIESQSMSNLDGILLIDFLTKKRQEMNIAVERVESIGFKTLSSYQVAIIGRHPSSGGGEELSEEYKYSYKIIRETVCSQAGHVLYMLWKNLLVMAMELDGPGQAPDTFKRILENACQSTLCICPNVNLKISMGRIYSPLTVIRNSFDEALFAFNIYELLERDSASKVISFDDIGFYRILRGSHNIKEFTQFYNETIGKLASYDKDNNFDLIKTLESYLENDCNLEKTSASLFIHKNTLRYRLSRIETITGKSLKSIKVLSDYYICFKIKSYLGLIDR